MEKKEKKKNTFLISLLYTTHKYTDSYILFKIFFFYFCECNTHFSKKNITQVIITPREIIIIIAAKEIYEGFKMLATNVKNKSMLIVITPVVNYNH